MTTPHEEQPATSGPAGAQATPEEAAAGVPGAPRVTTAPPRSRWRFGRVPARLGRARTSTVVLAVVWLLVALLWLEVRPPSAQIAPTGTETGTSQPVRTTAPARTTTTTTTTGSPSSSAPTSAATGSRTTSAEPSGTTQAPASTSSGSAPTTASSTTGAPVRTTQNPGSAPVLPSTGAAPSS
jgi:cytoskeletal protein RodZ